MVAICAVCMEATAQAAGTSVEGQWRIMVQRFDDSHIVVHLDRIMLERGVSLTELSGRVDITQANLSKIKNNHINAIRFSTLAAICEALSCTPGDLLEYRP